MTFINTYKDLVLKKDSLLIARVLFSLLIIVFYYIPVLWTLLKNTLLIIGNSLLEEFTLSGGVSGTNKISLLYHWITLALSIFIMTDLYHKALKYSHQKGGKKFYSLLAIIGMILFPIIYIPIIVLIDRLLPGIDLMSASYKIGEFIF